MKMSPTVAFVLAAGWLIIAVWAIVSSSSAVFGFGGAALGIAFLVVGIVNLRRARGSRT